MEVAIGYKKTEFGIIPEEWEIKQFSDISYMKGRIGWQGLKQTEFTSNPDEPFLITGMNFKDGAIKWDEVYHISVKRYEIAKDIQLKKDDVLITKDGTIGKLLIVKKIPYPYKASLNSHLLVFRPIRKSFYPEFLYYQLDSEFFKSHIELNKSGTTFYGVSQETVGKYKIPLPPLPEQKAIAEVLSDTDNLIQSLEKQIVKKRLIKQGAMQKLLSPKEGWKIKKLGDLADVIGGGTPKTNISSYWNGLINWFTPSEIGESKYVVKSNRRITLDGLNNCSAIILPVGTVLLTSRAGIGDLSILLEEACTNQGFQSLIAKNDVHNEFLYYLMLTKNDLLMQNASGSTFLEISPKMVKQIEISVPNYEAQIEIAALLSDFDAEIESLQKKLAKHKALKQGLMQNLLTGKIRL